MALSDWGFTGSGMIGYNNLSSPINSHCATLFATTTGAAAVFGYPVSSLYGKALTKGRYRSLMRLDNSTANSTSIRAGLVVMASATTIATSPGNFYHIRKRGDNIDLARGNTTTLSSGGTQLTTVAHVVTTNVVFSLQVEWSVEVSSVDFTIYAGSSLDFSDLAEVLTYSDTSGSRITTTVTEGITMAGSGSPAASTSFDDTTLWSFPV